MSEARTVISPKTIQYLSAKGHPLHYLSRWRHLTLPVDEYELTRAIGGLERTFEDVSSPTTRI